MAWISATYLVASRADAIHSRAEALALEQSVEMPLGAVRDPAIRENIVARVAAIEAVENPQECFRVRLELATRTVGDDPAQLMNMLFGNCSLQDDVQLEDVELPSAFVQGFAGPKYGVEGVREITGVFGRPLTCTALKPQGSSPQRLAELCETFAVAGIDIIKDDHGIANQDYAPLRERVRLCQAAIRRAREQTGRKVHYAPSLVGGPRRVAEHAALVREEGVEIVLVAPFLLGVPAFAEFAASTDLAILAHPALAGLRISPVWLIGRLLRLLGADAVIYPNYGGRFSYAPETCAALAEALRSAWGPIAPAFPVPAGGMTVERTQELVDFYGTDAILLIGGSLLIAENLDERSRSFVGAVEKAVTR